jgi:hypothetical protein
MAPTLMGTYSPGRPLSRCSARADEILAGPDSPCSSTAHEGAPPVDSTGPAAASAATHDKARDGWTPTLVGFSRGVRDEAGWWCAEHHRAAGSEQGTVDPASAARR